MTFSPEDYAAHVKAHREEWSAQARCLSLDPRIFFTPLDVDAHEVAAYACTSCPVKRPCLEFALMTNEQWGVWGGHTEAQRARIRRHLRAALLGEAPATLGEAQALLAEVLRRPFNRRPGRPKERVAS